MARYSLRSYLARSRKPGIGTGSGTRREANGFVDDICRLVEQARLPPWNPRLSGEAKETTPAKPKGPAPSPPHPRVLQPVRSRVSAGRACYLEVPHLGFPAAVPQSYARGGGGLPEPSPPPGLLPGRRRGLAALARRQPPFSSQASSGSPLLSRFEASPSLSLSPRRPV